VSHCASVAAILHRLVVGDDDADMAADSEVHGEIGTPDDQRELGCAPEELLIAAAKQVPAGDAEDHDGRGRDSDEQDVDVRPDGEAVREQLPDARQLGLPVDDVGAHGPLHPRVGNDDEEGREPAPEREQPDRRQVHALREPVPAEDPEAEERRLEHERGQPLDRERCSEDVPDELRIDGPVHSELELLHEPGRDPDREVDEHQRPEEAREPEPRLVSAAVPERLHDRDERREAERQRTNRKW
jgi:hypothetical protein